MGSIGRMRRQMEKATHGKPTTRVVRPGVFSITWPKHVIENSEEEFGFSPALEAELTCLDRAQEERAHREHSLVVALESADSLIAQHPSGEQRRNLEILLANADPRKSR